MYLLDTNVISEIRKGSKAQSTVIHWARSIPATNMYLSVVTIMEIKMGILSLERKDTAQATVLNTWISQQVLPTFAGRILDISLPVALRCAALHVPDPRSDRDALIAATALVHGLTVVTRNIVDFEATGVALFNPW